MLILEEELKSSGAKRVMRQNKNKIHLLLVFACNVQAMSKYVSAKRVIRQAAAAS